MKIKRMVVMGFNDDAAADRAIRDVMRETDTWIFAMICGGLGKGTESVAERWARKNGAPVEYIYESNYERLLDKIAEAADYALVCVGDSSAASRRIVGKMKEMGKHGKIYR